MVPEVGTRIALDVNDAGRVALGGSMGPEIGQIEGRLVQRDSEEYLVAVSLIHLVRGGEQNWSGEPVRVKSEYVTSVYERRFDRGRTIALGAAGVGSVVYLVTRSILGAGSGDHPRPPGDSLPSLRAGRR